MTSRVERGIFRAALLLIVMLSVSGSTAAQTPPPKPKPKPEPGAPAEPKRSEPKAVATLLILADEACDVTINGRRAGRLAAGERRVFPLDTLGKQLVEATTADGLTWSAEIEIEKAGQEIVRTGLAAIRTKQDADIAADIAAMEAAERARRQAEEKRSRFLREFNDAKVRGDIVVLGAYIWTAADNGVDVDWNRAKAHCDNLTLGGQSDWRLPTFAELWTLRVGCDRGPSTIPTLGLTADSMWSSTRRDDRYWLLPFRAGMGKHTRNPTESYSNRALCVWQGWDARGPEQNGFEESTLVVRDNLTWLPRDSGIDGLNWSQATAYCDDLVFAGYDDWRLPTADELSGLHDASNPNNRYMACPFVRVASLGLWSSDRLSSDKAMWFDFHKGQREEAYVDHTTGRGSLCVRKIACVVSGS